MIKTSEILFEYLCDMLNNPTSAELAIKELDEDFVLLGKGLMYCTECFSQYNTFAKALAMGDLGTPLLTQENTLADPLKSLCASLRNLTWQSQQVAKDDYKQRINFMGDFSNAFNTMIEQLADREKKLEDRIIQIQTKTSALEQSNLLLTTLMHYVLTQAGHERYLMVKSYFLEWHNANAEVFVISDISSIKNKMKKLEIEAYHDSLTLLYNRVFGMLTLDAWLHENRAFALIFVDLDNLKYINDKYGHNEGDRYIINTAKYLKTFAPNAIACRIGGDEFMLLVPDTGYDEAFAIINNICHNIQNDAYLKEKAYSYSISFGIAIVETDNKLPSSDILSIADERMYKHKRFKKMARQE